jgi:3-oxoacyl-[acyl-carrier protein] reductase
MWREGASLVLVARTESALVDLQAELTRTASFEQHAQILVVDLAAPDAALTIAGRSSHVDVLVNNAALLGPVGHSWESDWAEWQATILVDLLAPIGLCRAFVPRMIERGLGKVINLSGGGATAPRPRLSAYATAKAALVRFSETLAEELKGSNIQVNCVAPGPMNTEMNRAVLRAGTEKAGAAEFGRALELNQTAVKPPDAVELCVFLASAASDGISGKLISAVWDPWRTLAEHSDELMSSDIYTLRRIVPQDRGKSWD